MANDRVASMPERSEVSIETLARSVDAMRQECAERLYQMYGTELVRVVQKLKPLLDKIDGVLLQSRLNLRDAQDAINMKLRLLRLIDSQGLSLPQTLDPVGNMKSKTASGLVSHIQWSASNANSVTSLFGKIMLHLTFIHDQALLFFLETVMWDSMPSMRVAEALADFFDTRSDAASIPNAYVRTRGHVYDRFTDVYFSAYSKDRFMTKIYATYGQMRISIFLEDFMINGAVATNNGKEQLLPISHAYVMDGNRATEQPICKIQYVNVSSTEIISLNLKTKVDGTSIEMIVQFHELQWKSWVDEYVNGRLRHAIRTSYDSYHQLGYWPKGVPGDHDLHTTVTSKTPEISFAGVQSTGVMIYRNMNTINNYTLEKALEASKLFKDIPTAIALAKDEYLSALPETILVVGAATKKLNSTKFVSSDPNTHYRIRVDHSSFGKSHKGRLEIMIPTKDLLHTTPPGAQARMFVHSSPLSSYAGNPKLSHMSFDANRQTHLIIVNAYEGGRLEIRFGPDHLNLWRSQLLSQ
jgi:hypothetical protein